MTGLQKGVFLGVLLFFLVLPMVYAAELEVDQLSVKDSIIIGEKAAFDIRITNNYDFTDTFRITYQDLFWDVVSDPLYHYFSGVDIRSRDSEIVRLIVTPDKTLQYGLYRVDLTVTSEKGKNSESVPLFITVRPEKPLLTEYLAAVSRIVEIDPVIYPNENAIVNINLRNRNPRNLSDVKVILSSNNINREVKTSLSPLENKILEETFSFDPLLTSQKDILNVKLLIDGSVLEPEILERFEIGEYSDVVIESSDTESFFLKTIEMTTYTNKGNVENTESVELELGSFKKRFTSASPEPFEITKGEKNYLAWEFTLAPSQSITIVRSVSYRPLLVVVFIIAFFAVLYYLLKSPVLATKKAGILTMREGGISELKILIHIKNRSSQNFERITITDRIPLMAEVVTSPDLGTVAPASVYNDGNRTIVKWEIDKLEKDEERLLSYKMKSQLAILGSVTLPGVSLRFFSPKGTKLVGRSEAVKVSV